MEQGCGEQFVPGAGDMGRDFIFGFGVPGVYLEHLLHKMLPR